ncbi:MAG: GAF domain-containing protein [Actinomycetota bacterium]
MDRLERLVEAGLVLSSEHSLDAVLQRIVELAAEITSAQYAALGVLGPKGDRLVEFVTTGITEQERTAIGPLPVGHGLLGLLITEAKPLRVSRISEHPGSVGFPPHHPQMRSLLGAPITSRGRVFGNIYLTNKRDADGFTEDDEQVLVTLAAQAGVAIENARLHDEALARRRIVEAFREIATVMLEGADETDALRLIARLARDLVHADTATVATPDGSGDGLRLEVAEGLHADELVGAVYVADGSISGAVMETGNPLLHDRGAEDGSHPAFAFDDMGPMVIVPLVEGGRAFGSLAAINRRDGRRFDNDDAELLGDLAQQLVLALEYARAQREASRVAVMDDRERIAKDLHDGVIQALFAVGMGLQGAAIMTGEEEVATRLEGAVAEIDRVIRDLRNYIFGLRPGILADRQLGEALRQLATEFGARSHVVTAVDIDDSVAAELSSSAGDILQIAREALSNVGRHANAETCRLSLRRDGDRAVLGIDDDGGGFDVAETKRGDGLSNMERRAADLGATVSLASSAGEGTVVRFDLPLVSAY